MKTINILIVEDKLKEQDEWATAIRLYNVLATNKNEKYIYYAEFASTYENAKTKIGSFNFSLAVIDIRLKKDGEESNDKNTDGNEVVNSILANIISLIVIYTGQIGDVDIDDKYSEFIKRIDRDTKTKRDILSDFTQEHTLLESIINIKSKFSGSMSELFYASIWPRWKFWMEAVEATPEDNHSALTRHMATHLHASFLNEVTAVHPEEHYFIPPLRAELDTGDITLVSDKHYILVTPRCELAQKKNNTFQFVELKDISSELNKLESSINKGQIKLHEMLTKLSEAKKTMIEAKSAEAEKLVKDAKDEYDAFNKKILSAVSKKSNLFRHGGNKASLHFLPEIKHSNKKNFGPFHAQFDHLVFIPKSDKAQLSLYINGKYASLSNEFVPSLVERLGAYFSRIGTPDYSHPE